MSRPYTYYSYALVLPSHRTLVCNKKYNWNSQVTEDVCPWYRGPSFIQLIDELPSLNRKMDGPFIMPVVDKYKDMGTVLMGKVEAGTTRKGSSMILMPNRVSAVFQFCVKC